MVYYKLTDKLNKNEVIKAENNEHYRYQFGIEEWTWSGIMLSYMWPGTRKFGEYTEISEEEANQLLSEQREMYNRLLTLAIEVATQAHAGQLDKGGKPYINHPTAVAAGVDNTEDKVVAYLHDVVEDTDITLDDLAKMGFTPRIVNSVRILTKPEGMPYEEYLKGVRMDSTARRVKLSDLNHNMDISRIPNPTEKDLARIEKYKNAKAFLEE